MEPLNPPAAAIMLEQADARPGRAVAGVRGNFMHRAYGDVWRVAFRRPGHIFGSLSFLFFRVLISAIWYFSGHQIAAFTISLGSNILTLLNTIPSGVVYLL